MRGWTTLGLVYLAAVGVWVAFRALRPPPSVVGEVAGPELEVPEVPVAPLVETLPPDPPAVRHIACDGRSYGEGEMMPKCGRG